MTTYNREAYLKLKEEHPERIVEYSKKAYEKLKQNPDRLKNYRHTAYENYKENNAEKLAESRRQASKRFYEKNKEQIIQHMKEKYKIKKENESITAANSENNTEV